MVLTFRSLQAGTGALTKVGLINGGKQLLLRDTFATESAGAGYIY